MIIVYAIFAYICISVASMILFVITGEEANGSVVFGGICWPITLPLFILCQLYDLCIKMLKVVENEVKNKKDCVKRKKGCNADSDLADIPDEAIIEKDGIVVKIKINRMDDIPDIGYGIIPVLHYNKGNYSYEAGIEFYSKGEFEQFSKNRKACRWFDIKVIKD